LPVPLEQEVPFDFGCATHWSLPSSQTPVLQASLAEEQSRAVPLHAPELQVSFTVHHLPSSQLPALGCFTHWSVLSLQVPLLHWSATPVQSRASPPQLPEVQWSFTVQ